MAAVVDAPSVLERAHASLMRVVVLLEQVDAEADLTGVARAVERCLRAMYDAADGRREALEGVTEAHAEARGARVALSVPVGNGPLATVAQSLDEALGLLLAAQDAFARERPRDVARPSDPLTASAELPALHAVERAALMPMIRVAPPAAPPAAPPYEPVPSPKTYEELETFGARQKAHVAAHLERVFERPDDRATQRPPAEPSGEQRFVDHWGRECFEEIAMLASQRRPLLGDDWRLSIVLEQRMLWSLDAFASLGASALEQIETLVLDAPAADPPRAYAAGLVLGSMAGRDALGMAERIARALATDTTSLRFFSDALLVAPHPSIAVMLRSWLNESDPSYREVAARVLAARSFEPERAPGEAATQKELQAMLQDRPEIARHALLPLTLQRDPIVEDHVQQAAASPHGPLRHAAWLALALRSRSKAAERLRTELGGAHHDEAAALLAAVGNKDDASRLCDRGFREPTPAGLAVVGVCGSVPSIGPLLDLLRHDDGDVALAAAAALERITGAELRTRVAIAPDKLDAPELPDPNTGGFEGPAVPERDLGQLASDPRFAPSDGSPDEVELPPPSPEVWRAWWDENRARFEPQKRYRRGEPFSTWVAWRELDGPSLAYGERRHLGHELLALLGQHSGFSADAFVVQQERALTRWRPAAEKRSATPGAWGS